MDGSDCNQGGEPPLTERTYTALFPFGGIGGGALGFQRAEAELRGLGWRGTFRVLGGIDFDKLACEDFRRLTGAPSLCADVAMLTVADLRAFAGEEAPDVVFLSPPCKGASGLLSEEKARAPKYVSMNELALRWVQLMLAAWPTPPRLVLLENVPRLAKRAAAMLREVRRLLRAAGYVVHEGSHDCGEIGGLAQHRDRFLLVARHAQRVGQLLYQPPKRRVRACGEVLGELPLPGDPSAGPLHVLPRISMLNWMRLAAIPPGGDWRDLPGTGERTAGARKAWEQRGEKTAGEVHWFKGKYGVIAWGDPARTVIGGASNGCNYVADERIAIDGRTPFNHVYALLSWGEPAGAVNGGAGPTSGAASVADPRVLAFAGQRYGMNMRVGSWGEPAWTVTGSTDVQAGAPSIADERVRNFGGGPYGVVGWDSPSGVVTGNSWVTTGRFSVADPRLSIGACFTNQLTVLDPTQPARTITGAAHCAGGAPSVADLRVPSAYPHTYGVLSWHAPAHTITATTGSAGHGPFSIADLRLTCAPRETSWAYGVRRWTDAWVTGSACIDNGWFAVADPRVPGNPSLSVRWVVRDLRAAPPYIPVLPTVDGSWHRPLTTLELAVLQGFPATINGAPFTLAGKSSSRWREAIGNAVPVGAAEAIARQMLLTLVNADAGVFALSSGGGVWVREREMHHAGVQ